MNPWCRYLGYELVLHCFDRARRGPVGKEIHYARITASSRESALAKAREKGWVFFGDMDTWKPGTGVYDEANAMAFCPECVSKGRRPPETGTGG